jgi:chromosome segregation ATPase
MRTTLAATLVKSGASIQREDVFEAVREAVDSSRSAPRAADGGESILSNTSELLDAFQDGVDNIRHDLQKLMDRPVDLTSSYEILDTLKTGIEDVRADIGRLQDKHSETSESSSSRDKAIVVHDENQIAHEIESLKVMITQLRIKVEALDDMTPPAPTMPSEMRVHKEDLDDLHTAIQGVHATVREVQKSAPEAKMPANAASKDDTDAIETLLRNMKAKVDDMVSPDASSSGKTVQLETVEDLLRDVKVSVDEISAKADTQTDLELMELMLKDVQKGVDDLQIKLGAEDGLLSKTEIAVVESLCSDIKSQIEAFDPETMPTKEDVHDIRDSLKSFREQIDADNELTAQAFEARKIEHGGLANKIDDVKNVIGDLRDELMTKLDGSEEGIVELNKVLGMHHDNMTNYATVQSITELSDLVKDEFSKQTESKTDLDERSATLFNKHDEATAEVKAAIDEKFTELMTKYDDAQLASDTKLNGFADSHKATAEAMTSTKAVVEDLKSVMDTLGSTVTDTCDRMSDDAKTVYTKIDEATVKIDDLHTASAREHGETRDEVAKAVTAALRIEGTIHENQPAILAAIREVMDVVGQHYQHSQQHTEEFARATEEIKTGVNSIPASIPPLLPAPTMTTPSSPPLVREVPVAKEYDDTQVHDKLNNLISHAAMAKEIYANIEDHHRSAQESFSSLDKINEIHDKVMTAASEISTMVATQSRLMAEHSDTKTAEATEAAIALEKRTAQKEMVEAEIIRLGLEKNALIDSMAELKQEQQELSSQTKRLTREVAKLETALSIRQEEMRDMNNRAETLERRVLEGLMNHARSVKSGGARAPRIEKKRVSPQERDASMSLKRVPSTASASTVTTKSSKDAASLGSAVGVMLKKRAPLAAAGNTASPRPSAVDRRILSTSVMNSRSSLRGANDRALVLAPAPKQDGFVSLKRSQSVKSNPSSYAGNRKKSWGGVVSVVDDKENLRDDAEQSADDASDDGTERRTSILSSSSATGTSYMYTDSLTYGTGSDLSTRSGRTVSYASSIGGTLNGQTESIAEEDEDDLSTPADEQAMVLAEPSAPDNLEAGQDNSTALTVMDSLETVLPANADADTHLLHPGQTPEMDVNAAAFEANAVSVGNDNQLTTQGQIDTDSFDFAPPPLITDGAKYGGSGVNGSDSGLGTEPPTAQEWPHGQGGEALEYFQMTEEEMKGDGVKT